MIFVTVVDFKEFFAGGRLECQNLKYLRCAVMAELLTHLTEDVGGTRFESFRFPVINFPPLDVNVYFGVFSYLL